VLETVFALDCLATLMKVREETGVKFYDMTADFSMPEVPGTDLMSRLTREYAEVEADVTVEAVQRYERRIPGLTDEEIFYRMRELANRIHHDRHTGVRKGGV
jgi:hypothetical protein